MKNMSRLTAGVLIALPVTFAELGFSARPLIAQDSHPASDRWTLAYERTSAPSSAQVFERYLRSRAQQELPTGGLRQALAQLDHAGFQVLVCYYSPAADGGEEIFHFWKERSPVGTEIHFPTSSGVEDDPLFSPEPGPGQCPQEAAEARAITEHAIGSIPNEVGEDQLPPEAARRRRGR